MTETLSKIKPKDPLRLTKVTVLRKRKWSESSGNSPAKSLVSWWEHKKIQHRRRKIPLYIHLYVKVDVKRDFPPVRIFQTTVRLRSGQGWPLEEIVFVILSMVWRFVCLWWSCVIVTSRIRSQGGRRLSSPCKGDGVKGVIIIIVSVIFSNLIIDRLIKWPIYMRCGGPGPKPPGPPHSEGRSTVRCPHNTDPGFMPDITSTSCLLLPRTSVWVQTTLWL